MNTEFVDESTVIITENLEWTPKRPENKVQIRQRDILSDFTKQYPDFLVEKIEGDDMISNFRNYEHSRGKWVLTVKNTKTSKRPPETKNTKTSKKATPQEKSKQKQSTLDVLNAYKTSKKSSRDREV
tara:strand:+ start:8150 stop:8530 length:381 start_codon:yes stop_codon:yes gene_type:complete